MVDTPINASNIPTINLTMEEISKIEADMATGKLPPDFLDRHYDAVEANVFGFDHRKDRHGNPIEQGIGSSGNQTANSLAAYKKYCNPNNPKAVDPDPNFDENLKRMMAELAKSDAARAARMPKRRRRT
jgi:hypothetical protein